MFNPDEYRWCQFRRGCGEMFECYLKAGEAVAALNFVRFLS